MTALGILIGLGQGFAVGAAVVLVFVTLGLTSGCAAITGTRRSINLYGWAACLGAMIAAPLHLLTVSGGKAIAWLMPVVAALGGIYVGMLLCALVEVLNIFPVLTGRLKLTQAIQGLAIALALGKTAGVLVYYVTDWFAVLK